MILPISIYICFAALIVQTSTTNQHQRIIGGQSAKITDHPYQVSLRWSYSYEKPQHFCGGAIIDSTHILTAAHCVNEKRQSSLMQYLKVYTGTDRTDKDGELHESDSVTVHPLYRGPDNFYLNDVAIIKLKKPIKFTKNQKPVRLPRVDPGNSTYATITGWGLTRADAKKTSIFLQKSTMMLMDSVTCRQYVPFALQKTQICGYMGPNIGVCNGDSGGPLVYNGEIIGIASYVVDCAKGYPDVYTNVFKFRDFINKAIK